MPNLAEIIEKAAAYTKNHKFLWFFGFFLTGWGTLNFAREIDFSTINIFDRVRALLELLLARPYWFFAGVLFLAVAVFIASSLGAIARSAIIYTGLHLERREEVTFKQSLKNTGRPFWRVFWAGLFTSFVMFFILTWLSVPLWLVFRSGYESRGVLLTMLALVLFIPIIIILSLVNIFTACFVVVYDMKILAAFKSSFDLLANHVEKTLSLFAILFVSYFALFFFSATILGLFGFITYGSFVFLKGLPATTVSGILLVIISASLVIVNAILNVFTNLAWTLFFLKIVKAKSLKEAEMVPAV